MTGYAVTVHIDSSIAAVFVLCNIAMHNFIRNALEMPVEEHSRFLSMVVPMLLIFKYCSKPPHYASCVNSKHILYSKAMLLTSMLAP